MTAEERFMTKVDTSPTIHGCWVWTAGKTNGYGRFRLDGRMQLAHRASYEMLVGPIPTGLVIDHLCRNRACVRPEHLRACTSAENTHAEGSLAPAKRQIEKTHCPQGHPYEGENLYVHPRGQRVCRSCAREARHHYTTKQKAKATGESR